MRYHRILMFVVLLVSLALNQSPVGASDPVKLATVSFSGVRVPKPLVTSFEQTFALRLSQSGEFRVTTPRDIAQILGLERQKQLLGCADESTSCLAELAGALGVEGVISGELALVGKVYQLTLKVTSSHDAQVLFQGIERVKHQDDLLETIDSLAAQARRELLVRLRPPARIAPPLGSDSPSPPAAAPMVVVTQTAPSSTAPWAIFTAGLVLLAGGAISEGLAIADYHQLTTGPVADEPTAAQLRASGSLKQGIGVAAMGVGAAAVVTSLIWLGVTPAKAPQVGVWVNSTQQGLVVSGRF